VEVLFLVLCQGESCVGEESLVSKYMLSTCGLGVVVSSFVSGLGG
jgi:hypothetical protein